MRRERGVAAVELAVAFFVIIGLAIGTYELGTAFAEKTAMANATREGARAGAAAGEFTEPGRDADCVVLEAAAGALVGMQGNTVTGVWIYKTDSTGDIDFLNATYQHYIPDDDNVDLTCAGNWFRVTNGWPPASRDLGSDQWLGVRITVAHDWKTGIPPWNGTAVWEESAVMKLEPENPNSGL